MGFIGDMLGAGQGSGFQASGNAQTVNNPVTQQQIDQSYGGTQNSMAAQNALLQALQGQNGLGNQSSVFNQLQTVASGGGPNPAQAQYMQNANKIGAQTAGLIGSQKGMSPALQARMIAQQGAGAKQEAAGQGAANAAAQQLGAMNAMGNIANTQAANQIGQTNANTAAQQAEQQNLLGAQLGYGNQQAGILGNMNQTNSATQIQNSKAQQGIFGGLLGGAGGILSDEGAKKDIHPADAEIQQFLDSVGAHEYKYKDPSQPGAAPGEHTGPMAQELEQTEVGKQMVVNTPEGKGVDFQRGMGTILASLAHLNKKIEAMGGGKQNFADGGTVMPAQPMMPTTQPFQNPFQPSPGGPQSGFGMFLAGMGKGQEQQQPMGPMGGDNPIQSGMSKLTEKVGDKYIKPLFQSTETLAPEGAALGGGEAAGATEGASAAEGASGAMGAAEAAEGADAAYGGTELLAALAKGGMVQAKVSPGEGWLPPGKVQQVAAGKDPLEVMETIPGKPKVKGDSYKNDTVAKKLQVGGVVIPNSIMQSKNPAKGAKDFVANIIAKRKGRK